MPARSECEFYLAGRCQLRTGSRGRLLACVGCDLKNGVPDQMPSGVSADPSSEEPPSSFDPVEKGGDPDLQDTVSEATHNYGTGSTWSDYSNPDP